MTPQTTISPKYGKAEYPKRGFPYLAAAVFRTLNFPAKIEPSDLYVWDEKWIKIKTNYIMRNVFSNTVIGILVGFVACFCVLTVHSHGSKKHKLNLASTSVRVEQTDEQVISLPLLWPSLEDSNYVILASNLRRVRCPEETISDLICARITLEYRQKQTFLRNPMAYHWQTDDEAAAYEVKLKSLLNERDALLAQFRTEPAVDFAQGANNQTNALSPEKQQLVDEITKRYPSDLPSATATQEEVDTYYNNRKARLAYLAQYLTPDELTNYRLTQDSDVKAVALIMKALNLTPAELNSIAFALDFTQPNMVNGQFPPEVEQAFQQGLGPDRYAQYQNDYSSANIGLTQFISQTDLTPDQINQLEALQTQHQPPAVIAQTVTQFLGETFAAHYLNLVKDYTP